MSARYVVRADHTAEQVIDHEAVVISFDSYHYYGLNRTATAVWSLLKDGGRTPAEIAAAIADACDVPLDDAAADVTAVITTLVAEGLVEPTDTAAGTPAALPGAWSYGVPLVEKHGKLDQLMLSGE